MDDKELKELKKEAEEAIFGKKPKRPIPAGHSTAGIDPYNFKNLDPERARELRSKGGKNSRKKEQRRRSFKEAADYVLSLPAFETDNEFIEALKKKFPEMTNVDAMTIAVAARTIVEGDHKSYATLRDTVGESPLFTSDMPSEAMVIKIETVK